MSETLSLTVHFEDAGDGWVLATIAEVPGAISQGRTREEARENVIDAVAVGELDGRAVAVSGSYDGTLRVWDLASGVQHGEPLTGHAGEVPAVAVGELDGRAVAVSGGADGTLRVWDLVVGGSELAAIEVGSVIRAVQMRSPTILVGADAGVIALELMLAKPPA